MVVEFKYRLMSLALVIFLDSDEPLRRCIVALRMSGHSDCTSLHAVRLVNGARLRPLMMSFTDVCLTTAWSASFTNLQIWQLGSLHGIGFLLWKSDGRLLTPAMCWMVTWYLLAVDKKVVTLGLAENSPLHNF